MFHRCDGDRYGVGVITFFSLFARDTCMGLKLICIFIGDNSYRGA